MNESELSVFFSVIKQESIRVGCVLPAFLILGTFRQRPLDRDHPGQRPHRQRHPGQRPPDRDPPTQRPLDRDPWIETPMEGTWDQGQRPPRRNMGPGSKTGSDIIQRFPPPPEQNDWHMLLKTLPCPKLRLFAVITHHHGGVIMLFH